MNRAGRAVVSLAVFAAISTAAHSARAQSMLVDTSPTIDPGSASDSRCDGAISLRIEAVASALITRLDAYIDPTGPTTSTVMTTGEVAPGTTGFVGRIDRQDIADGDVVFVKGGIQAGTAKTAVFQYDATPDVALLNTDPVPTDQFGVGSRYARLVLLAASRSGNRIAVTARVKDTVVPRNKIGVLRCAP